MTVAQFTRVGQRGSFFEGPRWHDGTWYVSDMFRRSVCEIGADGREHVVLTVAAAPSGLGWLPDGSLLVVSMEDRRILRRHPSGEVTTHADLREIATSELNDMVVGADGHAYVGELGFDFTAGEAPAVAGLYHVTPDGTVSRAADGLLGPNGSVITPDGATLIVGESLACRYTAFDIGPDGSLSGRRVWAQLAPAPALTSAPEFFAGLSILVDGCALDAEGCIWAADFLGGPLIRIAPGGTIVDEIAPPSDMAFVACALGGRDRRTLLLAAIPSGPFDAEVRRRVHESVLLTTPVAVAGAGLP